MPRKFANGLEFEPQICVHLKIQENNIFLRKQERFFCVLHYLNISNSSIKSQA